MKETTKQSSSAKPDYCENCGKELVNYRIHINGHVYCSFKCADLLGEKKAGMIKDE